MPVTGETTSEAPVTAERLQTVLAAHPSVGQIAVASWTGPVGEPHLVAYIVPARGATTATGLEDDHLRRWEQLWSMLYEQGDPAEAQFDIRGWNSSYTRMLLPDEQMRDWVDQTVRSIMQLQASSVLEIGCGSGLLLHRIAPACHRYVATDFSAGALERLTRQVEQRGLTRIVDLRHAPAHDSGSLAGGFDAVVLNSVIQYFPTAGYLTEVLEQAVAHTRDGGTVFVGDVYSLALREALQASIVVHQATPGTPRELLRSRVLQRTASQTELLVHPGFFVEFAARSSRISAVEARPKYGRFSNEMTSFRYDVLLEVGGRDRADIDVAWLDWRRERLDGDALRRMLRQRAGTGFGVSRIPNARVVEWTRSWGAINNSGEAAYLATDGGFTADDLHALSAGTPHAVSVSCLSGHLDGSLDTVWLPRRGPAARPVMPFPAEPSGRQTNDPLWARLTEGLVRDLRQEVHRELGPTAAVTLVCVEEVPPLSGASEGREGTRRGREALP